MSEHPRPDETGPAQTTDDDAEAELIRKVLRTQERHREGGIDPELDEDAAGRGGRADESGGQEGGTEETAHSEA